jgi:Skp family chaperone for outer membrane proteins
MQPLRLLAVAALVCAATTTYADGTSRVAVVDTSRLYEAGGITRWLTARSRLDVERKTFVVVESPDGKTAANKKIDACRSPPNDDFKRICRELDAATRKGEEDQVWAKHEQEVLDPIAAEVMRALERYAQAHSIDLVLDRRQAGEMLLVVAATADITTAFIKSYNATAKPQPGAR